MSNPSPSYNNDYHPHSNHHKSNNNEANNNESNNNESNNNEATNEESFTNLSECGINVDLILKSIFFGAIFYLLSLPEVYKLTSGFVGKKVDGVLVHSLVYAVLYYILTHFI